MSTQSIATAFAVLKNNIAEMAKLNDSLFVINDFPEWADKVKKRSARIREMFIENEGSIAFITKTLDAELDKETAEAIFEGIRSLKDDDLHDAGIMISIMKKLLPFYEAEKNYDRLVFLNINIAYEEMEYFVRMDPAAFKEETLQYFKKVLEIKPHYQEIKEIENRRRIFMTYYNLIGPMPDLVHELKKDRLGYYEDAMAFYNSDLVQEIDGDSEEIKEELFYLKDVMTTSFSSYMYDGDPQRQDYIKVLETLLDAAELDDESDDATTLFLHYLKNNDSLDLLNQYQNRYDELVKNYKDDHTEAAFMAYCNLQDNAFNLNAFIEKIPNLSQEEKRLRIEKNMVPIKKYLNSVSFAELSSYYDDILADMCRVLLRYAKDLEEKEDLLMRLLVRRQPITYIHSLMVERIVQLIVEAAYDDNREDLFASLFTCKEDALDFLCRCARLHDVGKCRVAGVINMQGRKLTDDEFSYIKLHPEKSLEFLKDADFLPYRDIIIGHHKTYDGKGYPAKFDNTISDKKVCIDLLSIADSIDSATDLLGRNYTSGKDYYRVLQELIDGSGSRYNGDLVSFIAGNEELGRKLAYLTNQGRLSTYYEAYKKIESDNQQ